MIFANGLAKILYVQIQDQTKAEVVDFLIQEASRQDYDLSSYLDEAVLFRLINGRVPSDYRILKGLSVALTGDTNYEELLYGNHLSVHHHLLWLITKKIDFNQVTTPSQLDASYLIGRLYKQKKLTKVQLKQLIKFQVLNFPRYQKSGSLQASLSFVVHNIGLEPLKENLKYSKFFLKYETDFKKVYFKDRKHDKATLLSLTFAAELLAGIKNIYA